MSNVIALKKRKQSETESTQMWECSNCGNDTLRLYCDGIIYCQDCELTLQNITVVEIGTEDKP